MLVFIMLRVLVLKLLTSIHLSSNRFFFNFDQNVNVLSLQNKCIITNLGALGI